MDYRKAMPLALFLLVCASNGFAAQFDSPSGHMLLEAMEVDGARYRATFQRVGPQIFEQADISPSTRTERDAAYNPAGRNIDIDVLRIDGVLDLPLEMHRLEDGRFMATTLVSSGGRTNNYNREAGLPPMCYTRTEGRFNPCYTCHQKTINGAGHENRLDDGDLQGDYNFSEVALTNRWVNLFQDRSTQVAAVSDETILEYVGRENYSGLAGRLIAQEFNGWIPDLADMQDPDKAFAADGFANDGSGWVAFNYKPLPSTFWPTNGSTDDVMIRLPDAFRSGTDGSPNKAVYQANLAALEAAIKDMQSISIPGLNESVVGADLDGDGQMGIAETLLRPQQYFGAASDVAVSTYLYPEGTEFLHSVRYIGVDEAGNISNAPRMKELRYMHKFRFYNKATVGGFYAEEQFEKEQQIMPYFHRSGDSGLINAFGWRLQGFIENQDGELRPQNYEETFFCMGCHTGVGSTIDKVFSFARKVDGADGWGYVNIHGMPDAPSKGQTEGEFIQYLRRVGGGDEFRQNREMIARWLDENGEPNAAALATSDDIYQLITPSRERALTLNKAYQVIVKEQSYIRGRDATVTPATNVYRSIDLETIPVLPPARHVEKDIRLDWR